jgi:hypothetical protein
MDDGMGAGGDGRRDLGEVGVHRRSVGEGQHRAGSDPAVRADRAEEIGPLVAGVAGRPRSGAAPRPEAGERALLANPRLILKPDLDRLASDLLGDCCRYRSAEAFLV